MTIPHALHVAANSAVETAVSRFVQLPTVQRSVVILKDVLDQSLEEFPPAGSCGAVGVLIETVFTERRGRRKARKLLIHAAKATIEPLENAQVGLAIAALPIRDPSGVSTAPRHSRGVSRLC